MRSDKDNLIIRLTFEFSLRVIAYTETLEQQRKYNLANQLFRSGTSIGANVHEAQNAESKLDFIHKIKIAAKEADETRYWLDLCAAAPTYTTPELELFEYIDSIAKVLSKIISSSKSR